MNGKSNPALTPLRQIDVLSHLILTLKARPE